MKKLFLSLIVMVITISGFAQLNATISNQANLFCNGMCTGTATAAATGGTAPYTFSWNTVPVQTTAHVTNLCAGTYTVTVTDNASLTATATVSITQPSPIIINLSAVNVTCSGACNGVISTSITGGTPAYNYQWTNAMISPNIFTACAGFYSLTVTDITGCTATAATVITEPQFFQASALSIPDTCNQGHGSASVNITGGTMPFMVNWSTGSNSLSISSLTAGLYSVTATESNGCTAVAMTVVNNIAPSANLGVDYSICTGICDTITIHPIGGSTPVSYIWSNMSTNDSLIVCPAGNSNYSVTVTDAYGCSSTDNINVNIVQHCNTISGIFYQDLDNDGVQDLGENPLPNMVVMVTPGSYYATTNSIGYYEFLVDTGNFIITPINNSTYTVISPVTQQAVMYNAYETDALNNFGVYVESHGDLRVYLSSTAMRPGFASGYYLTYYNFGTDTTNATVILKLDAVPNFVSASQAYTSILGDSITWDINGMAPNSYSYIYVSTMIPVATTLGTVVTSQATILPVVSDTLPANNYSTDVRIVSGSWDPNDKSVSPTGVFPPSLVSAGNYLNYTIRFQNTGTDTAFNIHIIDTLSQNLNISSFELVSSSHPCNFNIHDIGIVDFIFNNILLPDSGVNEPGSNGYVQYKIKPKSTLTLGDEIENTAFIYFDFNQPVMTNTVSTMIEQYQTVTYSEISKNFLNVWPNPSNGDFLIACNLNNTGIVSIEVTDILGKQILNKQVEQILTFEFKQSIHIEGEGMYIVKVSTDKDVYNARIIISK